MMSDNDTVVFGGGVCHRASVTTSYWLKEVRGVIVIWRGPFFFCICMSIRSVLEAHLFPFLLTCSALFFFLASAHFLGPISPPQPTLALQL